MAQGQAVLALVKLLFDTERYLGYYRLILAANLAHSGVVPCISVSQFRGLPRSFPKLFAEERINRKEQNALVTRNRQSSHFSSPPQHHLLLPSNNTISHHNHEDPPLHDERRARALRERAWRQSCHFRGRSRLRRERVDQATRAGRPTDTSPSLRRPRT